MNWNINGLSKPRLHTQHEASLIFLFHNLNSAPALLLIIAVGVVGVLHTMVSDHWAPITVMPASAIGRRLGRLGRL
jgi:hypothetical protein